MINVLASFLIIFMITFGNSLPMEDHSVTCSVGVEHPWPEITYIPENSVVRIDCTTRNANENPRWSIRLAGSTSFTQFSSPGSIKRLNDRGFSNLTDVPEVDGNKTVRLKINKTQVNNETIVECLDANTGNLITNRTTLTVYDVSSTIEVPDPDKVTNFLNKSVNISWNSLWPSDSVIIWKYTVIVSSSSYISQAEITNVGVQQSVYFEAPVNTPPCEVYNFSVAATPVGATYTGNSCSVHSSYPFLSWESPSLPNITVLESSMSYLLERKSDELVLTVNFHPAVTCREYPVTNYTLDIKSNKSISSLEPTLSFSSDTDEPFIVLNLQEDVVYWFKIVAANSVGNISSSSVTFYTTDVQNVSLKLLNDFKSMEIVCTFIEGSQAQGCIVILGKFADATTELNLKITRQVIDPTAQNTSQVTSNIVHLICSHNYTLRAYDIEADGSNGTVPVPGSLTVNSSTMEILCPKQHISGSYTSFKDVGISFLVTIIGALLIFVFIGTNI